MATLADNLAAARDSLGAIIAAQTAAWTLAGCPPTFTIDGESYDWNNWLTSRLNELEKLTQQIIRLTPYLIQSRARG